MQINKLVSTALAVLLITFLPMFISNAETEDTSKSDLAQLDWLVGRWVGSAFGGECEEVWNPAMGGSMTGSFKLVAGGNIVFYELMTITIDSGKPDLRLKHFNADLTGWEEKDDVVSFKFVESGKKKINFAGLSYELIAQDSLRIIIHSQKPDGVEEQTVINCVKK